MELLSDNHGSDSLGGYRKVTYLVFSLILRENYVPHRGIVRVS